MKKHKKSIMLLAITLLIAFQINAQSNPCNAQWGQWQTVMTHGWGNVLISIQSSTCTDAGICGYPKIGLQHTFAESVSIDVKLRGIDCDGNPLTGSFSTGGNKINAYYEYKSQGNWHSFKRVSEVLRVEVSFFRGSDYYKILLDTERNISKVYKNNQPLN